MKWFKHDTDASNDPKIRKLKKKFGMVGYGVYFNVLELIARKMENDIENFGFLSDDWDDESLELEFGLDPNSVRTMFDYFCEIGLFEMKDGRLYNGKIQSRCDDYTSRMLRTGQIKPKKEESTNKVRTTTNNVPPDKIREDKIREEKKEEKIENSLAFLENIPEEFSQTLLDKYNVTPKGIKDLGETLANYCRAKGKKYSNYKAFYLNAAKREFTEKNDADRERQRRIEESKMAGPSQFAQRLSMKMKM